MIPQIPIPESWERANIRLFAKMKSGHTPSRSVPEYWLDTDIPWFTLADVWQLRDGKQIYLGETANTINDLGLANSAAELLPAGTVVLSRTASVGFSGIMPEPMATSQDFWNWVCGPKLLPEYLNYQFKSMGPVFKSLNMGSTHQTIYQKDAASLQIIVPPPEEQRAIADYLDRETARIDTLVVEQQRLIEMLRERRQSLVDGIFGGQVPNSRLQNACLDVVDCPHTTPEVSDIGDYEAVRTASVRGGKFRPGKGLPVDRATWEGRNAGRPPAVGDVLFTREAPAGEACMVPNERICLGQRMVLLRVDDARCWGPFLLWQIYSDRVQDHFRLSANGSTVANIRLPVLRTTPVWLPDFQEQSRIAAYLDEQTLKIDKMIAETELFIELSEERRSALITAAVTGQIDARDGAVA